MRNRLWCLALMTCVTHYAWAQNLPYAWNFTRQPVTPQGAATYVVAGAAIGDTGYTYLYGTFNGTCDFDPGPGVTNLTSAGLNDLFLVRYDDQGNLAIARQIGGAGDEAAGNILFEPTGPSIILSGAFTGTVDFDPNVGVNNLVSAGGQDAFVASYSSGGFNYFSAFSIGGPGTDLAAAVRLYGADIYVNGTFSNTADFDPSAGSLPLVSAGGADMFMARYNRVPFGTAVWAKRIGSAGGETSGVMQVANNSVYVSSSVGNRALDFDPNAGVTELIGFNGTPDLAFARYDLNGALIWAKAIGGNGLQFGNLNVAEGTDLYVGGFYDFPTDLDPGTSTVTTPAAIFDDAFLCRFDNTGQLVWAKTWSSPGLTNLTVQHVAPNGTVVATGQFEGTMDLDPNAGVVNRVSNGNEDQYLVRLNAAGSFLDGFTVGGVNLDANPRIAFNLASDKFVWVSTHSSAVDFDPSGDFNGETIGTFASKAFVTFYSFLANEPTAQPTALNISNNTASSFDFDFTAAAGTPDGYLVVRRAGASPTGIPKDGRTYIAGDVLGDGYVVQQSSGLTGTSFLMAGSTTYHLDVFAYNGAGGTTNYRALTPLEGSGITTAPTNDLASDRLALIDLYNALGGAGWTTSTNWLGADPSNWVGVTVSGGRVTQLSLPANNLIGRLPAVIGNLTALTTLGLNLNSLSGGIPPEIAGLTNLTVINLANNQLSGPIPNELSNLSSLASLYLDNNQLDGAIPTSLGSMSALLNLSLGGNNLTGSIPPELGNLSSLQTLVLGPNQLSGSLPPDLGNLSALTAIDLRGNQLTGSLPPELSNLSSLNILHLADNQLSGSIPAQFGNIATLTSLFLNNNQLTGSIPPELGNLTFLTFLNLNDNNLSGSIPLELGSLSGLLGLLLNGNNLSGNIPSELGNLTAIQQIWLSSNELTGAVPSSLAGLASLSTLALEVNQLTDLPDFSGSSVSDLFVANNQFTFEDLEPNISKFAAASNYTPQKSIGTIQNIAVVSGQPLNLSFIVGGANNIYQWKRTVTNVGTNANTYNVPATTATDNGSYTLNITNSIVPGLTITSAPIIVNVKNEGIFEWANGGDLTNDGYDEVTGNSGFYGGIWGDINNDGFDDVFVGGFGSPNRGLMYKNNANGTFSRLPYSAYGFSQNRSPVFGDYDNDGRLDLYVPQYAASDSLTSYNSKFFRNNGNETFAIIDNPNSLSENNAAWADYDLDGDLDVIASKNGGNTVIHRNNGAGNFSLVTPFVSGNDWHTTLVDIDNDGDLDVFMPQGNLNTNQRQLYRNNGSGLFALETSNLVMTDVGVSIRNGVWADIDNDGDYDLYSMNSNPASGENAFFVNDGTGNFSKVLSTTALGELVRGGRGATFLDFDNDGWQDLLTMQGNAGTFEWLLFRNNANGTFTRQLNQNFKTGSAFVGASASDFDNDGFVDLVSSSYGTDFNGLYRNKGNGNNWLQVKLRGTASNRDAVGTKISVKAGGTWRHAQVLTSNGFANQNSLVQQFGLGAATQADSVRVKWPTGATEVMANVPANQRMLITEVNPLTADSLALVALYNATNGAGWTTRTGWLAGNVSSWYGVSVKNSRVTKLALTGNNLTGSLPPQLGNLLEIDTLYLNGNRITGTVPTQIGNLQKLRLMDLGSNQLSGSLPASVFTLLQLRIFGVANNQLSGTIPTTIGNLTNLISLWLDNNKFSGSLPSEINNLTALQNFYAQFNEFTTAGTFTSLTLLGGSLQYNLLNFNSLVPNAGVANLQLNPQKAVRDTIRVTLGSPLSFSYDAGGTGTTYQWNRQGQPAAGQTNSIFSIGASTVADAGRYVQVATNPGVPFTLSTTDYVVEVLSPGYTEDSGYTFWKKLGAEALGITPLRPNGRVSIDNAGDFYFTSPTIINGGAVIQKANAAGNLLFTVNSGNADIAGTDIAIDGQNSVYVPGPNYATLKKYNSSGSLVFETPVYSGSRPFQTIAVDLDGSILAMDLMQGGLIGRINRFDSSTGNQIGQISLSGGPVGSYQSVFDFDIDASGNIYVADVNRIDKFSPTGTFISSFDVSMLNSWGGVILQVADNGHLYAATWFVGNIYHFDATGNLLNSFGFENSGFSSLTISATNELIAGNNSFGILRFDLNGNFLGFAESRNANGQFNKPVQTANDSKGNRYVVDQFNYRIQKFNANGDFQLAFGSRGAANGQFNKPAAIAIDPFDVIYVADAQNNNVQKFNASGTYLATFGSTGTANGQFINPTALAISPDQSLYVADADNYRVQKFTLAGTHLLTFGALGAADDQFGSKITTLAAEENGSVVVMDQTKLKRFDPAGQFVEAIDLSGYGTGQLATDRSGFIYLSTGSQIRKFEKQGALVANIGQPGPGDGQFVNANSISTNATGDTLWISSFPDRMSIFYANFRNATSTDSLALVDLYTSTRGSTWTNRTNWLTGPVQTWYGVKLTGGKVRELDLTNNNLDGPLPSSFTSLNDLVNVSLDRNKIAGSVPDWNTASAIVDLDLSSNQLSGATVNLPPQLQRLDLSDNQLADVPTLPPFLIGADLSNNQLTQLGNLPSTNPLLDTLFVQNNQLTFEDLEPNISIQSFTYAPQDSADLTESVLKQVNSAQTFSASIGGANNQYQWKKNGTDLAGETSASITFSNITFLNDGEYTYEATNSVVAGLTLKSRKKILRVSSIQRDSVALTKFFNDTGGPTSWIRKDNWTTTPLATGNWFGVTIQNNRVTRVILPNNGIRGALTAAIADVENLVEVDLSDNNIEKLPPLTSLPNITSLDVSGNRLDFASLIGNSAITGIDYQNQAELGSPRNDSITYGTNFKVKLITSGTGNQFQWKRNGENLADATDSTYTITNLNRSNMGDYVVEITNPSVPGLTLRSATQRVLATATLSGTVLQAPDVPSTAGKVTLFRVVPGDAFEPLKRQTLSSQGNFQFEKVVLDDYILLAESDTLIYTRDLPTYYKNTLYWEEADTLFVNENQTGLDILMQKEPTETPRGQGTIKGIFEDTQAEDGRLLSNKRIANAGASVRRRVNVSKPQAEILELVAYVFTDEEGFFEFNNLETGSYLLNLQLPGVPMDPNSFININIGTGLARNVEVAALVIDGKISVRPIIITGWDEREERFRAYPNPVSGTLSLEVLQQLPNLRYTITNTMGAELMAGTLPLRGVQDIATDQLPNGVYLVTLRQEDNMLQTFRIVVAR